MSKPPVMVVTIGDKQTITIQVPARTGTDAGIIVQDHAGQQLAVLVMEDGKLHYYPADAQEMLKRLKLVP